MNITSLGEPRFPSPRPHHISDKARVLYNVIVDPDVPPAEDLLFEVAGPRERLFFDPAKTRAGIVTCGGLCPGLNNVIRSLVLELHHGYGVHEILGFVDGYQGLDPWRGAEPIPLTPHFVENIHKDGGTVLNTSRGPVDVSVAVDNLIRRKIDILFVIGGDGTQRGGAALFKEATLRGHALAVVGIPKTIDNDVAFVSRTFGYLTAVEEAAAASITAFQWSRSWAVMPASSPLAPPLPARMSISRWFRKCPLRSTASTVSWRRSKSACLTAHMRSSSSPKVPAST
jgi:6-phosphofructokinase 1